LLSLLSQPHLFEARKIADRCDYPFDIDQVFMDGGHLIRRLRIIKKIRDTKAYCLLAYARTATHKPAMRGEKITSAEKFLHARIAIDLCCARIQ
jgi:hypothetical protein